MDGYFFLMRASLSLGIAKFPILNRSFIYVNTVKGSAMTQEAKRRIFLAVMLEPYWQKKMSMMHANIKDLKLPTLHLIPSQKLHITVHFWADATIEQTKQIIDCTQTLSQYFPAFSVSLGNLELFPSENKPRVLAIDIQQANVLRSFRDTLSKRFAEYGISVEHRAFRPHISIARVFQKIHTNNPVIVSPLDSELLYIDKVQLLESTFCEQENIYTPLASFELQ